MRAIVLGLTLATLVVGSAPLSSASGAAAPWKAPRNAMGQPDLSGYWSNATLTPLTRNARIQLIDNPERITPIALNRAIAVSRGEFILRVDAHSTIAPDYIDKLVVIERGEIIYTGSLSGALGDVEVMKIIAGAVDTEFHI
mgnify:CR=1 FL=1